MSTIFFPSNFFGMAIKICRALNLNSVLYLHSIQAAVYRGFVEIVYSVMSRTNKGNYTNKNYDMFSNGSGSKDDNSDGHSQIICGIITIVTVVLRQLSGYVDCRRVWFGRRRSNWKLEVRSYNLIRGYLNYVAS